MPTREATLDLGALGPLKVDVEFSTDTAGETYIRHVWGAPLGNRVDLYPLLAEWAVDELNELCSKPWHYD